MVEIDGGFQGLFVAVRKVSMHESGSPCTNVVRFVVELMPAVGAGAEEVRARLSAVLKHPKTDLMATPRFLDDIGSKLSELAANSPARDIEKNVKAMLGSAFGKLDLVTREEFEVQREVLAQARQKLAELEARVAELEGRRTGETDKSA